MTMEIPKPFIPNIPNSHAVLETIAKRQAIQIELATKQLVLLQEISNALHRLDQPPKPGQ